MADPQSPANYAEDVAAARDRLVAFALDCTEDAWRTILDFDGDSRTTAVLVDHVGHSYEYLAAWIRTILDGTSPRVSREIVDELNAKHAVGATQVTKDQAAGRLRGSGDAFVELVRSLAPEQLDLEDGRLRRFVEIAIRHPDDHRRDIEARLAAATS